jgi:hypothetical protein
MNSNSKRRVCQDKLQPHQRTPPRNRSVLFPTPPIEVLEATWSNPAISNPVPEPGAPRNSGIEGGMRVTPLNVVEPSPPEVPGPSILKKVLGRAHYNSAARLLKACVTAAKRAMTASSMTADVLPRQPIQVSCRCVNLPFVS